MAAGLCPDPLGELKRSPRPPSRKGGLLLRGGERRAGEERGGGRDGRGEGEGERGGEVEGNLLQGVRGIDAPLPIPLPIPTAAFRLENFSIYTPATATIL